VVTAVVAVTLVLVLVGFRGRLFGSFNRVRVHPARGKIAFEGQPIANATLYLHPVGGKATDFPRPRAIVGQDGTFLLGTYRKDDGAPAGEYKVTVQWFSQPDGGGTPRNLLPPRYAVPETSDLTVRIQKGENQIPPIQLTRVGKR
jgi:hypothetical protein